MYSCCLIVGGTTALAFFASPLIPLGVQKDKMVIAEFVVLQQWGKVSILCQDAILH
jgi:hypothetical protein